MRYLIFLVAANLLSLAVKGQENACRLRIAGLDSTIDMAALAGRKVVILECNMSTPSAGLLLAIDSLYRNNRGGLAAVVVPVGDSILPTTDAIRGYMRGNLGLALPIAMPGLAKKAAGSGQHPLLRWLTHKSNNGHFDADITGGNGIFVLSSKGVLYALLNGPADKQKSTLLRVLAGKEP